MYRHAVKLGLQTKYNEENGIIKKKIVRMMLGLGLLHPLPAKQGFMVIMKKINIVN
jgi:hypothetical protein